MILRGEPEAVAQVLAIGAKYGYGNLIAHLRRAWALSLKNSCNGSHGEIPWTYEQAVEATIVDAYPENWDIERMVAFDQTAARRTP